MLMLVRMIFLMAGKLLSSTEWVELENAVSMALEVRSRCRPSRLETRLAQVCSWIGTAVASNQQHMQEDRLEVKSDGGIQCTQPRQTSMRGMNPKAADRRVLGQCAH